MIGIVLFNNFASFEIILSIYLLKTKYKICTFSQERIIKSLEGLSFVSDYSLQDINDFELSGILIPGGDITNLNISLISKKINEMNDQNMFIGSICSGVEVLHSCGVLMNKRFTGNLNNSDLTSLEIKNYLSDESLVVDSNLLTSKPEKYIDFAIESGKIMNIYRDKSDLDETIDFFKFQKTISTS